MQLPSQRSKQSLKRPCKRHCQHLLAATVSVHMARCCWAHLPSSGRRGTIEACDITNTQVQQAVGYNKSRRHFQSWTNMCTSSSSTQQTISGGTRKTWQHLLVAFLLLSNLVVFSFCSLCVFSLCFSSLSVFCTVYLLHYCPNRPKHTRQHFQSAIVSAAQGNILLFTISKQDSLKLKTHWYKLLDFFSEVCIFQCWNLVCDPVRLDGHRPPQTEADLRNNSTHNSRPGERYLNKSCISERNANKSVLVCAYLILFDLICMYLWLWPCAALWHKYFFVPWCLSHLVASWNIKTSDESEGWEGKQDHTYDP